jgi:hypothetical protein
VSRLIELLEGRTLCANGFNVVLDPGHGGNFTTFDSPNLGTAGGWTGVKESALALDIASRVRGLLSKAGYTATLTRTTDVVTGATKRAKLADKLDADFFLSLHFTPLPRRSGDRGTGAMVDAKTNINLADDTRFADIVRTATLRSLPNPVDRGTRAQDLTELTDGLLGNSVPFHPTVSALLEIESISSNQNVDRFFNPVNSATRNGNRQSVAKAIAAGITEARVALFGSNGTPTPTPTPTTGFAATFDAGTLASNGFTAGVGSSTPVLRSNFGAASPPSGTGALRIDTDGAAANSTGAFGGTSGSSVTSGVLAVPANGKLAVDYNFLTDEDGLDGAFNDFAMVNVLNASGTLLTTLRLVDTSYAVGGAAGSGYDSQSGWIHEEFNLSGFGGQSIRLQFVVSNRGDNASDSALLIDNVAVA